MAELLVWDININNIWKGAWSRLTGYGYLYNHDKFIGFIRKSDNSITYDYWGKPINRIPKYVTSKVIEDLTQKISVNYQC